MGTIPGDRSPDATHGSTPLGLTHDHSCAGEVGFSLLWLGALWSPMLLIVDNSSALMSNSAALGGNSVAGMRESATL